ncbi:MAG: cell division protein CrgA [Actinomycetota bacterium]
MAPPKRTTSGRVTPKGTKPGEARPLPTAEPAGLSGKGRRSDQSDVAASSRYTPPTPPEMYESPRWVPILMALLIGVGVLVILLHYFIWTDTNWPVAIGLVFLLGGLYTATKWH